MGSGVGLRAFKAAVKGRVHRVGYRRFVLDAAQELGVSVYVENLRDGSVEVFAQGSESEVKAFLDAIKAPPKPAVVIRSFDVEEVEPKPEVEFFEVKSGSFADDLQEGFGAMETEFRDYRDEFRGFAEKTEGNFRNMEQRYGEISDKLTLTLEALRTESSETRRTLAEAIESLKRDS